MRKIFSFASRHAYLVISIIFAITIGAGYMARGIGIDTSFDRLLVKTDPKRTFYQKTISEFGDDTSSTVYFEDDDLFSREKLESIQKIIWELQELEGVVKVDSIFTSPHFVNQDDVLASTPAFEIIPDSQEEIDRKIRDALNNPLLRDQVVSSTKTALLVSMQVDHSQKEYTELSREIDRVILPLKHSIKTVFQTGETHFHKVILHEMAWSQKYLLPVVIVLIMGFVYLGLKTIHAAIIPLLVFIVGMLWTAGVMVAIDIPVQMLISSIPILCFVLGSTEITHLLSEYESARSSGKSIHQAIQHMAEKVGLAISMTAFTTLVGFLSICTNDIQMLREFGLVSGIALFFIFIVTLFFVPAYLKIFDRRMKGENRPASGQLGASRGHSKVLSVFQSTLYNKMTYLIVFIYVIVCAFLMMRVRSDNESIAMIKSSSPTRKNVDILTESFPGIKTVYLVLESHGDTFKKSAPLELLYAIHKQILEDPRIDSTQSFAEQMAFINREMRGGDPRFLQVPQNDELIAQYLLNLTRDDVESYVSADYRRANLVIRHNMSKSSEVQQALADLDKKISGMLKGRGITHEFTSRSVLNLSAGQTIVDAQTFSLLIMFLSIFLVVSLLFWDFRVGLIALPSNALPVLGLFAIMGASDISLNIGTCIVAAVTIGIAVDDTIHFFSRYAIEQKQLGDPLESAKAALGHEIIPIVTTSISLAIGFSVLVFSDMMPLVHFGLLSAVVILLAMVSDLLITPAFIVLFKMKNIVTFNDLFFEYLPESFYQDNKIFSRLKPGEIKRLISFGQVRFLEMGARKSIDQLEDKLFVILDGSLQVKKSAERTTDDNEEISLASFKTGAVLGNPKGIQNDPVLSAGKILQADKISKVMVIDNDYLSKLKKFSPKIYSILIDNIDQLSD